MSLHARERWRRRRVTAPSRPHTQVRSFLAGGAGEFPRSTVAHTGPVILGAHWCLPRPPCRWGLQTQQTPPSRPRVLGSGLVTRSGTCLCGAPVLWGAVCTLRDQEGHLSSAMGADASGRRVLVANGLETVSVPRFVITADGARAAHRFLPRGAVTQTPTNVPFPRRAVIHPPKRKRV